MAESNNILPITEGESDATSLVGVQSDGDVEIKRQDMDVTRKHKGSGGWQTVGLVKDLKKSGKKLESGGSPAFVLEATRKRKSNSTGGQSGGLDKDLEKSDQRKDRNTEDGCGKCKEKVIDEGLQCDLCDIWWHVPCSRLTTNAYIVFSSKTGKHLWFCITCKRIVKERLSKLNEMENTIVDYKERLNQKEEECKLKRLRV
jgi:hypothetical protein